MKLSNQKNKKLIFIGMFYILTVGLLGGCDGQNNGTKKSKDLGESAGTRATVDILLVSDLVATMSLSSDWTRENGLNHYQNPEKTMDLWVTVKEEEDASIRVLKEGITKYTEDAFGKDNVQGSESKVFEIGQVLVYYADATIKENQVYRGCHIAMDDYYIKMEFYMTESMAAEHDIGVAEGEIRKIINSLTLK